MLNIITNKKNKIINMFKVKRSLIINKLVQIKKKILSSTIFKSRLLNFTNENYKLKSRNLLARNFSTSSSNSKSTLKSSNKNSKKNNEKTLSDLNKKDDSVPVQKISTKQEIQIILKKKNLTIDDLTDIHPQTQEEINAILVKLGHIDEKGHRILTPFEQRMFEPKRLTLDEIIFHPVLLISRMFFKFMIIAIFLHQLYLLYVGKLVIEYSWIEQHSFKFICWFIIGIPITLFIILFIKALFSYTTERISWWPKFVRSWKNFKKHPTTYIVFTLLPYAFWFFVFIMVCLCFYGPGNDWIIKDFFYMHEYVSQFERTDRILDIKREFSKEYPQFAAQFQQYYTSQLEAFRVFYDHGVPAGDLVVRKLFNNYTDLLFAESELQKLLTQENLKIAEKTANKALQEKLVLYETARLVTAEGCFVVVLVLAIIAMCS